MKDLIRNATFWRNVAMLPVVLVTRTPIATIGWAAELIVMATEKLDPYLPGLERIKR